MDKFLERVAALVHLHEQGLDHGDIRADHLLWTGSLKAPAENFIGLIKAFEVCCTA